MKEVKVLYSSNFRNISESLRAIAAEIEAGIYGEVDQVAVVMHSDEGQPVKIFHLGEGTATNAHLLLGCGMALMQNAVMFPK